MSNVRSHLKRSLFACDLALRGLGWLLVGVFVPWLCMLVFAGLSGEGIPSPLHDAWFALMFTFFAANTLASIVGLLCVVFTSNVKELRVTWVLAFLGAFLLLANVFLVPLFRCYALRRAGNPDTQHLARMAGSDRSAYRSET